MILLMFLYDFYKHVCKSESCILSYYQYDSSDQITHVETLLMFSTHFRVKTASLKRRLGGQGS